LRAAQEAEAAFGVKTKDGAGAVHGVAVGRCCDLAILAAGRLTIVVLPSPPMQILNFELRGEFITLDRLLKATGTAPSGGAAKALVADGRVQVDGRDELRKTAKLRAGQVVALTGVRITLMAPAGSAASPVD
jgi:ribosome-associated protein